MDTFILDKTAQTFYSLPITYWRMVMEEISPDDRYLLRRAQMDADKKALDSQRSQQELERTVLDLEHKY